MLDEVKADRRAFACMLGGEDRSTLFITTAQWLGMDKMNQMAGTGQIVSIEVTNAGTRLAVQLSARVTMTLQGEATCRTTAMHK
ncbi:Hypothetical protein RG1141_PA12040 (plasmid) [Neorhizobium galegae bv. officinalis bv. officinalis str. HAMBI 1141]|uniref:Uncharacterized protein n=1 Tax=Neorhizobium galegae bv. officinalis bv. officinalis str. HAMBI 1141 TaxID=1028801 RepID=A0A068TIY3_NEOGA|nr:hypothetical protein [Neorhizobium galegae]CDN58036.1 Hypothetical protein RG1141_PA12040 [Neorhizobium galegae bv. officinalis bv. officinalis str. HAMBI 1141]